MEEEEEYDVDEDEDDVMMMMIKSVWNMSVRKTQLLASHLESDSRHSIMVPV